MLIKTKISIVVASLLLASGSMKSSSAHQAEKPVKIKAIKSSLKGVPAAEIPAKASEIIKAANKKNQLETAKMVLRQVLAQRPQMVVQMVASILKTAPETAPDITYMAISIMPQFADAIIRAAVICAPNYAVEIAVASSQIFPDNKSDIVKIVSLTAPYSTNQVAIAIANSPTRIVSNGSADNHATGGAVNTINTGISHPWPSKIPPSYIGGSEGFDPLRYNK
jgi:hypothetical protein